MRYSIKEKRRFHFRQISTTHTLRNQNQSFNSEALALLIMIFSGTGTFRLMANRPLNHRLMSDTAFRDTINWRLARKKSCGFNCSASSSSDWEKTNSFHSISTALTSPLEI